MDKKKVWDNIQDSSKIVLSVVSLFALPEIKTAVGLSSSAVSIVNRILNNTELLDSKDSINDIADSQLNRAIELSMRYTYDKINTDTAQKLVFYMRQRLSTQFSFTDSDAYEKLVTNAAEDMDKYDALYVDRRTILEISSIFLNRLRIEINDTKNQQLFNNRRTDIDDLILNTLGAVVGYMLFELFACITKRTKQSSDNLKWEPVLYVFLHS